MNRLTRDGTAEPVSRDQILRHARGQGNIIFPVQLTTSRIGNLTRLIHALLYVMTIHTYIHTYIHIRICLPCPISHRSCDMLFYPLMFFLSCTFYFILTFLLILSGFAFSFPPHRILYYTLPQCCPIQQFRCILSGIFCSKVFLSSSPLLFSSNE